MRAKIKTLSVLRDTVSILPLLFLFTILLLHLALPEKTYSREERRYLEQWPTFHVGRLLDGSYETKMESYFSDQFPFRSFWVHVYTELQAWPGHRSAETTQYDARITLTTLKASTWYLQDALAELRNSGQEVRPEDHGS